MAIEAVMLDKETQDFFASGGETGPEAPPEADDVSRETPESKPESKPEPKAEVKAEAKPEPKAEAKPDDAKPDPHAENHRKALKETREEFKAFKRQVAEEKAAREAELAAMNDRLAKMTQGLGLEPKPATFEEQPADYLKTEVERTKAELAELKKYREDQEKTRAYQASVQQFQNTLQQHEAEFLREQPDYNDAAQHVGGIWRSEFEIMGVQPAQIGNALQFKIAQFANAAVQRGENPAKAVYDLAKRSGYQVKQPAKPVQESKIESIQSGQEAAKTLGGGSKEVDITLESLSNMSQEDIERLVTDPKAWARLARGG